MSQIYLPKGFGWKIASIPESCRIWQPCSKMKVTVVEGRSKDR